MAQPSNTQVDLDKSPITWHPMGHHLRRGHIFLFLAMGLLLQGSLGCPPPDKYCVRRAALVPVPAPSMRPVIQSSGAIETSLSTETLTFAKAPKKLTGRNVGIYVPREQLAGQFLLSPLRALTVGLAFESGLARGSIPISPGLIRSPRASIGGVALHLGLDLKVSPRVTVGLSCDGGPYWVQSRIAYYDVGSAGGSCQNLPPANTWPQKLMKSTIFFWRAQLGVGVDLGWGHLSAGVGVRNQPVNVNQTTEFHDDPVTIGPKIDEAVYPYGIVSLEIQATKWMGISLAVYQPLNVDPIIYAPIVGLNIRLTASSRSSRHKSSAPKPAGTNQDSDTQFSPLPPARGSAGPSAGNQRNEHSGRSAWLDDEDSELP